MPLEWIIFQIFINIVEVGVLFYLLCSKFENKSKNFISTLSFVTVSVIVLSLRIFIPAFETLPTTEIFLPLACFVFLLVCREGRILRKIFWSLFSCVLVLAINFATVMIITIIADLYASDIMVHQASTERLILMILAKTLQVGIFYVLAKRKVRYEMNNSLSNVPLMICFSVPLLSSMLIAFVYILIMNDVYIPQELAFPVGIIVLIINVMIFALYEIINREANKNYVLIAKNKQYEMTEEHNKQVVEMYDRMSEWRHDYKHHMGLLLVMLEKNKLSDNDEAINYIKELDSKIKNASLEIITGNTVVDAIASAKATLAEANDITFKHSISLINEITIDSTDLCSILSNLLDNAIEACCKLSDNRYIHLEMLIFRNQLSIKIINSSDGQYNLVNGKFKTTKKGDLHGIGMGHVRSIVESYDGIFAITPEADSFTTSVSIPIR